MNSSTEVLLSNNAQSTYNITCSKYCIDCSQSLSVCMKCSPGFNIYDDFCHKEISENDVVFENN